VLADTGAATVGQRPLFRSTITGGMNFNPVLDFDGTNDKFTFEDTYGITGSNAFTIYTVTKRATINTNDAILSNKTPLNNNFTLAYLAGSQQQRLFVIAA